MRNKKQMDLPKEPYKLIDPDNDQLVLFFDSDCKFVLCSPGDAGDFEDQHGNGLPNGKCFKKGESWAGTATVDDVNIQFCTFDDCPPDPSTCDTCDDTAARTAARTAAVAAAAGHVIIIGSGNGVPMLKALSRLFRHDRAALHAWPETRKVLETVLQARGLVDSQAELLELLIGEGSKLNEKLHKG